MYEEGAMRQAQIFISYSHENRNFAYKIYDDLLSAGYWVWWDERLKAAQKWEPQIQENLRKSETFIALLSSQSIESAWVRHEGSMAFALEQDIIPVQIEPFGKDAYEKLPIWVKPIQLYKLFEGSADYEDKFLELKQLLGEPLPIRQYLEEMLPLYQKEGILLDEVALVLINKHYHELHLPKDKKELADKLIRESIRKRTNYWIRYEQLHKDYEHQQKKNELLRKENDRLINSDKRDTLIFVFTIILLLILAYLISPLRITFP